MKREHWIEVESTIEGLNSEIKELNAVLVKISQFKLGSKVRDCVKEIGVIANNLKEYSDIIYSECEDDWAVTDDNELEGYEEVVKLLPNGSKLSVAEVDALVEHINNWKIENGYSTTNC